jgi:hypothetical protein
MQEEALGGRVAQKGSQLSGWIAGELLYPGGEIQAFKDDLGFRIPPSRIVFLVKKLKKVRKARTHPRRPLPEYPMFERIKAGE